MAGAPLTWHFHTAAPVPPHIVSHAPADGAVGVSITQPITVVFDSPMDASTLNAGSFYYNKLGAYPLPATITYDPATMTAVLTPAAPLLEATTYQLTLTSTVRSSTGLFVAGTPIVWTFTTILAQPPQVLDDSLPPKPRTKRST